MVELPDLAPDHLLACGARNAVATCRFLGGTLSPAPEAVASMR